MPFGRMLREGNWLREGDFIARVFDEGANARGPVATYQSEQKNPRCALRNSRF